MRHYQGQERGRLFPGKAPACARDYADNIKISKNGSMNKVFLVLRARERESERDREKPRDHDSYSQTEEGLSFENVLVL